MDSSAVTPSLDFYVLFNLFSHLSRKPAVTIQPLLPGVWNLNMSDALSAHRKRRYEMTLKTNLWLAGAVLVASAGLAHAEMTATAINDLNVRAGPGPQYPSVGIATRGSPAILDGCIENSRWCRVDVNGVRGWVFAEYLQVDQSGTQIIVEEHQADLGVPVVTYESTASVVPAEPQPAPGDELLGPVGSVEAITPPETVRTYIETNPGQTVRLGGDVVVGAEVPADVTYQTIPDYDYRYVRINDRPVLVDPGTRRIVYVYQ
jgi:uncharacterized protein YraI